MFTIIMMVLSSLVTLYFARAGFRKRVNNFFDWSDNRELPVLEEPVNYNPIDVTGRQSPQSAWMEWTEDDEENKDANSVQ